MQPGGDGAGPEKNLLPCFTHRARRSCRETKPGIARPLKQILPITDNEFQLQGIHDSIEVVPEARLELASLAAEDFESPASTIPPLGPLARHLEPGVARVNAGQTPGSSKIVGLERVAIGQLARLQPDHEPA